MHAVLQSALVRAGPAAAGLGEFYQARDYRPLWITGSRLAPEAGQMARIAAGAAGRSGSPPDVRDRALASALAAAGEGGPAALADAEIALSAALVRHVQRLRARSAGAQLAFVDAALEPPSGGARAVLEAASRAPSLGRHLGALEEINPVYQAMRAALAGYRARWSGLPQVRVPPGPTLAGGAGGERVRLLRLRLGLPSDGAPPLFDRRLEDALRGFQSAHGLEPTGRAGPETIAALNAGAAHYERLIAANLERARALPPSTGRRYILVNTAAGRLSLYEDGRVRGSMRVAVGKPRTPTPMMAGVVRYAVFNPYWNIPEDLVRDSIAPKVLRSGPAYFEAAHMQALSDWSGQARELDPRQIDWPAVAAGRISLRVRQRPGADNMMGSVKFMLPNQLGIYLHDTPDKSVFLRPRRLVSAGCVRLEHASELARWLLGDRGADAASMGPDQRVDLGEPTPVYITYLTAAPGPRGVEFYPDVYGRDRPLPARRAAPGPGEASSLGWRPPPKRPSQLRSTAA